MKGTLSRNQGHDQELCLTMLHQRKIHMWWHGSIPLNLSGGMPLTLKLWYPVQECSCWFGTLFKRGPQILDPIQEVVYFSWQLTMREKFWSATKVISLHTQVHPTLRPYPAWRVRGGVGVGGGTLYRIESKGRGRVGRGVEWGRGALHVSKKSR